MMVISLFTFNNVTQISTQETSSLMLFTHNPERKIANADPEVA
jgi:hypothetical protein